MIRHSKALIILVIKKLKGLNYFSYKKKNFRRKPHSSLVVSFRDLHQNFDGRYRYCNLFPYLKRFCWPNSRKINWRTVTGVIILESSTTHRHHHCYHKHHNLPPNFQPFFHLPFLHLKPRSSASLQKNWLTSMNMAYVTIATISEAHLTYAKLASS